MVWLFVRSVMAVRLGIKLSGIIKHELFSLGANSKE